MRKRVIKQAFYDAPVFVIADEFPSLFLCVKLCAQGVRISWDEGCRCCGTERKVFTLFSQDPVDRTVLAHHLATVPELNWFGANKYFSLSQRYGDCIKASRGDLSELDDFTALVRKARSDGQCVDRKGTITMQLTVRTRWQRETRIL